MHPRARSEALVVEVLPDEVLIYDQLTDRAHCLNRTAALVWRAADGEKTVGDIGRILNRELGIDRADDVVLATLEKLAAARLLDDPPRLERRISRRELGRRMAAGAALAAIPAVLTIGAPSAVSAASCVPMNGCCSNKTDCCPGLNCEGPFAACSGTTNKRCF
jgi:hypothetical protein